jgi:hypothetical protein
MIDLVCPPWFIETRVNGPKALFQHDLNKIYEGVDYKPFLRLQVMLKFVFVASVMSQVDSPRILNLWVAVCFFESLQIDKFCFVWRYRKPPQYDAGLIRSVVRLGLPVGLILHVTTSLLLFGVVYRWELGGGDGELTMKWNPYGSYSGFSIGACVVTGVFLILWLIPLKLWAEPTEQERSAARNNYFKVQFNDVKKLGAKLTDVYAIRDTAKGTVSSVARFSSGAASAVLKGAGSVNLDKDDVDGKRISSVNMAEELGLDEDLTFTDVLRARETHNNILKLRNVEVKKYIPNPTRREFGVVKIN